MPNMQFVLVGTTKEHQIDCIIYCCDKAEYKYEKARTKKQTCRRIGTRKHSCVLHNLREKDANGKLTKTDRIPGVTANMGKKVGKKMQRPDIVIKKGDGHVIWDAKFPCDPDKAVAKMDKSGSKYKSSSPVKIESTSALGKSFEKNTSKEMTAYRKIKIDGKTVKDVKCRTPQDAKNARGDCTCKKVKK